MGGGQVDNLTIRTKEVLSNRRVSLLLKKSWDVLPGEVVSVNATTFDIVQKEITVTSGAAQCWMQAVDLAGNESGWGDPSEMSDFTPAKILHLKITSSDAIIVIETE